MLIQAPLSNSMIYLDVYTRIGHGIVEIRIPEGTHVYQICLSSPANTPEQKPATVLEEWYAATLVDALAKYSELLTKIRTTTSEDTLKKPEALLGYFRILNKRVSVSENRAGLYKLYMTEYIGQERIYTSWSYEFDKGGRLVRMKSMDPGYLAEYGKQIRELESAIIGFDKAFEIYYTVTTSGATEAVKASQGGV